MDPNNFQEYKKKTLKKEILPHIVHRKYIKANKTIYKKGFRFARPGSLDIQILVKKKFKCWRWQTHQLNCVIVYVHLVCDMIIKQGIST